MNNLLAIKGVGFYRNCGAASVGEYKKVIWFYQLSWYRKVVTVKSFKADVSSVSPSSELRNKVVYFGANKKQALPTFRSKCSLIFTSEDTRFQ